MKSHSSIAFNCPQVQQNEQYWHVAFKVLLKTRVSIVAFKLLSKARVSI